MPKLLVALVAIVMITAAPRADASERRIALVHLDAALVDAIRVALEPWDLRVLPLAMTPPTDDVSTATTRAGGIATEAMADAVLWVVLVPGGSASLWLYDAETRQVVIRPLGMSPPFDDASAAAVALSVKTLLRSTRIAPPAERVAEPPPRPLTAPATPPSPSTAAKAPDHVLWVHADAGGRVLTGAGAAIEPRFGLGASVWPRGLGQHIGFGLDGRFGTGIPIDAASFQGRFSDTALSASAQLRAPLASLIAMELGVASTFHITSIDGVLVAEHRLTGATRVNPSLDGLLMVDYALGGRVGAGLFANMSFLLRTQTYSVVTDSVLRLPPVGLDVGARLSVALD